MATLSELDFIEELRLRRWARENYVPSDNRDDEWHPVILEEMGRKDEESFHEVSSPSYATTAA